MIGKWNKSVILTYVSLVVSTSGMMFAAQGELNYAIICLIVSGVCDLFDGLIARHCERTAVEKRFGVELDSLVDTVSFGVLPVVILIGLGMINWYFLPIYGCYLVCQIARLAHFNTTVGEEKVKYYSGLPVTYSALIFPVVYLAHYFVSGEVLEIILALTMLTVAILNIVDMKVRKPGGIFYVFFSILAIAMVVIYLVA